MIFHKISIILHCKFLESKDAKVLLASYGIY